MVYGTGVVVKINPGDPVEQRNDARMFVGELRLLSQIFYEYHLVYIPVDEEERKNVTLQVSVCAHMRVCTDIGSNDQTSAFFYCYYYYYYYCYWFFFGFFWVFLLLLLLPFFYY